MISTYTSIISLQKHVWGYYFSQFMYKEMRLKEVKPTDFSNQETIYLRWFKGRLYWTAYRGMGKVRETKRDARHTEISSKGKLLLLLKLKGRW